MKKTKSTLLKTFLLTIVILIIVGCEQDDYLPLISNIPETFKPGVFILNEGNFGTGNGSVSFLDLNGSEMYNQVFKEVNGIPLGDIPQSMFITDTLGFIVVNNSAKIEVVNMDDFTTVNTISGFTSPRHFLPVSDSTAYVSDLYNSSITVVNINNFTITGSVETGKSTEQMVKIDGEVFVANWSGGNKILVIEPASGEITDSIDVILEPNSMVLDKNNKLWVLCSGGYMNEEMPGIICIDPVTREKEKTLMFNVLESSPSNLNINGSGDTLYFLNNDIFKMSVEDPEIPSEPLIHTEKLYYNIGVDPENGVIYAADAVDYHQKGKIFRYMPGGALKDSFDVDIIPGTFVFNR